MKVKLFEIRDRGTCISAMAINLIGRDMQECALLKRAGFGPVSDYILLTNLDGGTGKITYDEYEWGDRTMKTAHNYIIENWDSLPSGIVIDVEFILGETKQEKESEMPV
jgi:hypothetical protein